ncbi:MAG: Mg/Co/Ni transporter MgtE, CBS domain-containing [uncultured Sphingomonas sp.]|uniref:Magnesium transporter MgtE n=1 Tax=uncultured Sphingomonas sp. TaxID=158754 RepID=A0A6J4T839_9SPHN|nr:MAG: Mg/Co/Ni transporter MgtE, CBS domain-containing [uncultured Sphingomonas sp.]
MSESDQIAAAPPTDPDNAMDAEDRLRPEFVERVLDAVDAGDDATARELVEPLHPADVADLIELAARDEREGLVKALAGIVDADVLAEMNDYVREGLLDQLEPEQVADLAGQMDTDDAVAIIEDLEEDEQRAVLRAMEPDDRAAIEEALTYPEESAGRLMQRDLIAVPDHWQVGQVIDYLRSSEELADDFWEVFVVSPSHHPVGTCKLSTILRSPRRTPVADIMQREQTLIPVDMDQEDVALRFQKYALVSAAVVDGSGRLVGMITVDDVVHIIQEEASEDALLLSGVDEGDINEPVSESYRSRVRWLMANLVTALVASFVIRQFEDSIERLAILAVLMPIVAGVGGNAGTQALAVTVRAIATNQLTGSNRWRAVWREIRVAVLNGVTIAVLIGIGVTLVLGSEELGLVIAAAMLINIIVAGTAGALVPLALERAGADPAVASSVFLTMVTDSMGFLAFLGLATASGLVP